MGGGGVGGGGDGGGGDGAAMIAPPPNCDDTNVTHIAFAIPSKNPSLNKALITSLGTGVPHTSSRTSIWSGPAGNRCTSPSSESRRSLELMSSHTPAWSVTGTQETG